MIEQILVRIEGEQDKIYENRQSALDYAFTRVVPWRPVIITNPGQWEVVMLERREDFTITVSRDV